MTSYNYRQLLVYTYENNPAVVLAVIGENYLIVLTEGMYLYARNFQETPKPYVKGTWTIKQGILILVSLKLKLLVELMI